MVPGYKLRLNMFRHASRERHKPLSQRDRGLEMTARIFVTQTHTDGRKPTLAQDPHWRIMQAHGPNGHHHQQHWTQAPQHRLMRFLLSHDLVLEGAVPHDPPCCRGHWSPMMCPLGLPCSASSSMPLLHCAPSCSFYVHVACYLPGNPVAWAAAALCLTERDICCEQTPGHRCRGRPAPATGARVDMS